MTKYRTYIFRDQDPAAEEVVRLMISRNSIASVARASGVSASTLGNWRSKKTKSPQFCTLQAAAQACGKTFKLVAK